MVEGLSRSLVAWSGMMNLGEREPVLRTAERIG